METRLKLTTQTFILIGHNPKQLTIIIVQHASSWNGHQIRETDGSTKNVFELTVENMLYQ